MQKMILASNNAGKLREMRAILQPFGFEVLSQREAGFCEEVEETGTSFAENAQLKEQAVYQALHVPVLADDSGLMVDALDGAPGIYSHRFAGEDATDQQRCEKLLTMLQDVPAPRRTARFVCAVCYLDESGEAVLFTGTCEGTIGTVPAGTNGFGYDPVFYYGDQTLAQMTDAEKNQISHRANALRQLEAYLQKTRGESYVNK